jgi:hypothetical protein
MDPEVANWLAGLIQQTITQLANRPCMIVEVEGDPKRWLQIIPQAESDQLSGLWLNFTYKNHQGNPLDTLEMADITAPPGSQSDTWEDNGYATIRIRPDVPILALTLFIGDLMECIVGAAPDDELSVQIEHGY